MGMILVTGANGCIGSHLIEELVQSGYQVTALALDCNDTDKLASGPNVEVVFGDICDKKEMDKLFSKTGFEVVIHLAALVHMPSAKEKEYMLVNRDATINLFRLSQKTKVRQFIFFSTVAVYGDETKQVMNEDDAIYPSTLYSLSKAQAEEYITGDNGGWTNYTIIRPATVYGKNDKGNIDRLIKLVKRRIVPVIGNGENLKSFVFVENLVQGVIKIINNPNSYNEIFILCDENPYSINRIVHDMINVLDKKVIVIHIPERIFLSIFKKINKFGWFIFKKDIFRISSVVKLTTNNVYDISKARKYLNYQPEYTLVEGLRKTYISTEYEH